MRINITTIKLDLTPVFKKYIEKRFLPLRKLIGRFDSGEVAELRVEVSRTTRHHRRGDVFLGAATLRLPKTILRAEETADEPHAAVDAVRDTLRREIMKYKTKLAEARRGAAQ